MALAGVEHDQAPAAEPQRHGLELERGEVDQQRRVGLAVERGELVEQSSLGAHPLVLHTRAHARELEPAGFVGVDPGEREQREAEGDLERGRGGEPGAARQIAADLERGAAHVDAEHLELGGHADHERAPAVLALALGHGEGELLVEIARVRADHQVVDGDGLDDHSLGDREGEREPAVVVGVLADQVDASGAERADPLCGRRRSFRHGRSLRHGRARRAARLRSPRAACPR